MGDSDEDRRAILARRSRLIALALGGITSAAAPGCYESHTLGDETVDAGDPLPCLSRRPEDAGPDPCLGAPAMDSGAPTPCLEAPEDAGQDGQDAEPMPCLSAPS